MHYEKNLCENILKTILGEMDFPRASRDFEDMGIRPELWLRAHSGSDDEVFVPDATYFMNKEEKRIFVDFMKSLRTPTNYASAIHALVEDAKFRLLKSHHLHLLMQQVSFSLLHSMAILGVQYPYVQCLCNKGNGEAEP